MKRTLEMNIIEASKRGTELVCVSTEQVETILKEAERIGVKIEKPILINEYKRRSLSLK